MQQVKERCTQGDFTVDGHPGQQCTDGNNHQVSNLHPQLLGGQGADKTQHQRGDRQRPEPGQGEVGQQAGFVAEDQGIHPDDGVNPHLGHDGKQGCDGRAGGGIGARQPEIQGDHRRLEAKDQQQQDSGGGHQRGIGRIHLGHPLRHVRHVECAGQAVQDGDRNQEQRRSRQVKHHVMQTRLGSRRAIVL